MNCKKFEAHVDAFANSTLSQSENKQAQEHLNVCASCGELYQATIEIKQVMQDLSIPTLSDDFNSKLKARLSNHKEALTSTVSSVTPIHSSTNNSKVGRASYTAWFSRLVAGFAIFALTFLGIDYIQGTSHEAMTISHSAQDMNTSLTLNEIVMELNAVNQASGFYGMDINELLESTSLPENNDDQCLTTFAESDCEILLYSTDS